jgi:hypothetical protein
MFGSVNDEAKEFQGSGSYGNFGLNTGKVTKIGVELNGGAGGTPLFCFDVNVEIAGKESRRRFFDPTGKDVYFKGERLTPDAPNYKEGFEKAAKDITAAITHCVKAVGVTQEALDAAFATPVASFAQWCQKVQTLIPATAVGTKVDVMLHYQSNIKGDNKMTFLELPEKMIDGRFICASVVPVGKWNEVRNEDGLHYVDNAGNKHPFTRTSNFLESKKANQQKLGETPSTSSNAFGGATASTGSTWGN